MPDEPWYPLGVDQDDAVAAYDALHDGLPPWMEAAYWAWVKASISRSVSDFYDQWEALETVLVETMCQVLRIPFPTFGAESETKYQSAATIGQAMKHLRGHPAPLQIADYLLAFGARADGAKLEEVLARSKSLYTVGERADRKALVQRVPEGVKVSSDSVMARSGRAGVRLAQAWQALYGVDTNPSEAYRLAILAVEDAAVPVVSPTHKGATLGSVISQLESQKVWRMPMEREDPRSPTGDLVIMMMRALYSGQHDRHGGQPSAPGNVSADEARVAVSLAVALVGLFIDGLVQRAA
jgi:hypothetical protein